MQVIVNGADVSASYTEQELEDITVELIAFDGEAGQGTLPHPDAAGSGEWYAGQTCKVQDGGGPTVIVDGFVGDQDRERGETARTGRRLETFHLEDPNARLTGHRAIGWARPSETDRARVLAFAAAYVPTLSTTQVLNTNLATLAAKTYTTEDLFPDLLADVREATGKTIYVVDGDLHSHLTTEGPACTIALTDGDADFSTTWPVYDPHRTKDKGELFNDVTARNQGGSTANAQDATSISRHNAGGLTHEALLDLADVATASLPALASAYLAQHKDERKTYSITTGPFTPAQTALLKPGMLIVVTSQAVGLSAATERIGRMTWQYKHPSQWWATLELSHPLRVKSTKRATHAPSTGAGGSPAAVTDAFSSNSEVYVGIGEKEDLGFITTGIPSYAGSWIYDNVPYTNGDGCASPYGGWRLYWDSELWYRFTAPADSAAYLGLTFDIGGWSSSVYAPGMVIGIAPMAPADATAFGTQWYPFAMADPTQTRTYYVPRSMVVWGAYNSIVLSPIWRCDRPNIFTCKNLASGPLEDGSYGSGRFNTTHLFIPISSRTFASGASGRANWVSPYGAVNGTNRVYTLISWDGTGTPQIQLNGILIEPATILFDTAAKTATLQGAPLTGALLLADYSVAA